MTNECHGGKLRNKFPILDEARVRRTKGKEICLSLNETAEIELVKSYLFLCCPLSVDLVTALCWSSAFAEVKCWTALSERHNCTRNNLDLLPTRAALNRFLNVWTLQWPFFGGVTVIARFLIQSRCNILSDRKEYTRYTYHANKCTANAWSIQMFLMNLFCGIITIIYSKWRQFY